MNTFDAVNKAVSAELPSIGPLPPCLQGTVKLLSQARLYYRAHKLGSAYEQASKDPENGNPVAYGAALHLVADHTSLGYALSAALAAKCALDLLRGYRQVGESTQEFWNAVKCQYPVYHPVEWKQDSSSWTSFLFPSFNVYCQIKTMQMVTQLKKVSVCAAKIVRDTFLLSMRLADVCLISTGDQTARFEGFTELVAEWETYQGELENNKKRFLEELENNSVLIDQILDYLQMPESCTHLIDILKKHMPDPVPGTGNLKDDLYEVGKGFLDPLVKPGKITAIGIDLSEGKAAPPALPPGRYPPWGGQKVKVVAALPKRGVANPLLGAGEKVLNDIMNSPVLPFGSALKGAQIVGGGLKNLIWGKASDNNPPNPFA